jgi:hypothetical protein
MRRSRKGALLEGFEQLLKSDSPHQRGYSFEDLLSQFLCSNGFQVHPHSRAASPRRTDIFADYDGHSFVIEAKWRKKDVGADDIDALRSRLEETPPDVIGCIFSVSDFSRQAIERVKQKRTREILLFNAREIHGLFASKFSLSALLQKKRTQLRAHATVWFEHAAGRRSKDSKAIEAIPSTTLFVQKAGNISPWVTKCSDRDEVVFSHELPYVENSYFGDCVGFRVFLGSSSVEELRHVLGLANRHFRLSQKGSYSIHQTPYAWHGFGVRGFLKALESWRARYAEVRLQSYHHSEELAYFDQLDIGMFCLNARQQISNAPFIYSAEIQIRIPGVPVAAGPFQSFCKDLDIATGYFESLRDSETDTIDIRERIPLDRTQLVISVDGVHQDISGAIVRNPFYMKPVPFNGEHSTAISFLGQSEFIFCAMRDWLPVGCQPGTLVLQRVEATWVGHSPILRPVCTWEYSVDTRPRSQVKKEERKRFEEAVARTETPNITPKKKRAT